MGRSASWVSRWCDTGTPPGPDSERGRAGQAAGEVGRQPGSALDRTPAGAVRPRAASAPARTPAAPAPGTARPCPAPATPRTGPPGPPPQQRGDPLRLPPVEVERDLHAPRLRQPQRLVPDLEAQLYVRARGEYAVELREGARQFLVRDVDRRVPGEQAAQRGVRDSEAEHGPLLEAQARVLLPGHGDHLRREVDPEHVEPQAQFVQMCGHAARSAADVGHGQAAAAGRREFRERAQQRALQRLGRQLASGELDVGGGQGVVRLAGRTLEIGRGVRGRHGRHSRRAFTGPVLGRPRGEGAGPRPSLPRPFSR